MIENEPLMSLWKAEASIEAIMGVSVIQPLVRVDL